MTSTQTETAVSTWTIDPAHSEVGFAVKHMMITTVKGAFTAVQGTVTIHESDPAQSSVEVTIDAGTIDTRVADRDEHLRSADFFDVEQWPTITFRSRRVQGAIDRERAAFTVIGDLTLRDVTREVALEAEFEGRGEAMGAERASFSATTSIDRREFGLRWNRALEAGGVLVGNDVKITVSVQLVRE